MQHLIKASFVNKFTDKFSVIFLILAFLSIPIALYYALVISPPDYQQGETVRIMYIHVPSAWLAMGLYFSIAFASFSYLVWRNPISAILIKSMLPIGALFCLICLITGAIWGRPIWGVYWVWDARLTSMLILFFLYIGLILLKDAIDDSEKSMKSLAIVAIIGSINLPIIRFSVNWWATLHQPASVMRFDKPALHIDILTPLLVMTLCFVLITISLILYKVKTELLNSKLKRIQSNQFDYN